MPFILITGKAINQEGYTTASASSLYSKDFTTPEAPTPQSLTETTQSCSGTPGKNSNLNFPLHQISHLKKILVFSK